MLRSLFAGCVCLLLLGGSVRADDYLIHVESVGYEDVPDKDREPLVAVLHSLDVVAQPGKTFRGRCTCDGKLIVVKGKLKLNEKGALNLSIQYKYEAQDPKTYVEIGGIRFPGHQVRAAETELTVKLGEEIMIGAEGSNTGESAGDKTRVWRSSTHTAVRVTKFHPDEPTPEDMEFADQESLRGTWNCIEATDSGQRVDQKIARQIQLQVIDERMNWQGPQPFGKERYEFRLDGRTTPHRIQLRSLQGHTKNRVFEGAYDLSSGDLVIAIPDAEGNARATTLESADKSHVRLFRLSRGLPKK